MYNGHKMVVVEIADTSVYLFKTAFIKMRKFWQLPILVSRFNALLICWAFQLKPVKCCDD